MNFKIENNFLDITNYPYIEKHFKYMASQGWLIKRIIVGSIFIYKKVKPEELDFSISPYQIETTFTRKTKEELEEFQSVCESVGWNYATKSYDLHIYFKEAGAEAVNISTDDQEEFDTLERIGKRQIKESYILIPIYLFLAWTILGGLFKDVYSLKDGLVQIIAPLIPMFLIVITYQIFKVKKFLKINKENVELGKVIEYRNSKHYIERAALWLYFMFLILFIGYSLYAAIVLNNRIILIGLMPIIIGFLIGGFYKFIIKPSRNTTKFKKIVLIIGLVVSTILSINIGMFAIERLSRQRDNPDMEGYMVLAVDDFSKEAREDNGELRRNISFLIPVSYEYSSYPKRPTEDTYVRTEYSKALSESISKTLINRYIKEAKKDITNGVSWEMDILIEEDLYDYYLEMNGLTEGEFDQLKIKDIKEAKKEAIDIIKKRSIVKDNENLWGLDEVYFLNYQKNEIVIRDGKEVFYLDGKDFSDAYIIKIVKDELDL